MSSGVSFYRYLRPFLIAAAAISTTAFLAGMFIVPQASKGFKEFKHKYISRKKDDRTTSNLYKQINDNEYVYVSSYNPKRKRGNNFTVEYFEGKQLKLKIVLVQQQLLTNLQMQIYKQLLQMFQS